MRSIKDIRETGAAWVTETELEHLCDRCADLAAKIQFLLRDFVHIDNEDGVFTFPDGESWERRG